MTEDISSIILNSANTEKWHVEVMMKQKLRSIINIATCAAWNSDQEIISFQVKRKEAYLDLYAGDIWSRGPHGKEVSELQWFKSSNNKQWLRLLQKMKGSMKELFCCTEQVACHLKMCNFQSYYHWAQIHWYLTHFILKLINFHASLFIW